MHLHKVVNGRRVEMSPEEEANILSEWAENERLSQIKRQEREQKQAMKLAAQQKLAQIAGLTDEEKELIFN